MSDNFSGDQSDSDDSVIGKKQKRIVDYDDDLSDIEPTGEKVEGKCYNLFYMAVNNKCDE